MKKPIFLTILSSLLIFNISCNNDFDNDVSDIKPSTGEADFSRYVALGNSLTAGFRDGALFVSGQEESYPAMIAAQMKLAGGGEFKIPMMADDLGGIPSIGVGNKLVLEVVNGSPMPVPADGTATTTLTNIYAQGPYQNMGLYGAKVAHLLYAGYGNPANLASGTANPYFVRFASNPNATVLGDAVAQNPTFFSLWTGIDDVTGYAMSGGDGSNPITDAATFQYAYETLVKGLTANGAKGVVASIPNVTALPFFITVPYNALDPKALTASNPNQITELNEGFAQLNQVFDYLKHPERKIVLSETQANPVLINDKDLEDLSAQITAVLSANGIPAQQAALYGQLYGRARQATADDYLVLTSSSIIGQSNTVAISAGIPATLAINGVTYPLEDKWVLTANEAKKVLDATASFNTIIKNLASQYDLAFADINSLMTELSNKSGITYNGVTYTNTFVTGGAYSLDGIHPNGRGYGFVANEFIKAINQKYHSTLTQVNPNVYTGITFP